MGLKIAPVLSFQILDELDDLIRYQIHVVGGGLSLLLPSLQVDCVDEPPPLRACRRELDHIVRMEHLELQES